MAPSLDLHIGTHKTGTTAVQYACHTLQPRLAACGVLYPSAARGPEGEPRYGHHPLQWGLRGARGHTPSDAAAAWADVAREVAERGPAHVVVSSEGFESLQQDAVQAVAEHARHVTEGPVRVVLYLRPLYAYLRSAYKQQLQGGTTALPFEAFALHKVRTALPARLAARWADAFGADALVVRLFDEARRVPGGLLADFLGVVTAPAPSEVPFRDWLGGLDAVHNPSLGDAVAPAVARINRLTDGLARVGVPQQVRRRVRGKLVRSAAQAQRRWPDRFASAVGPLASPDAHDRIRTAIQAADFDGLAPWLTPDEIETLRRVG